MIWFTSDLHLYHKNVILYCSRPFAPRWEMESKQISDSSITSMNETLVENWCKVVKPEDDVYCLGDFSMAFRSVELYSHRLTGRRFLVSGNHDICHSYHRKSRDPENRKKWIKKYEDHGWIVLPEQTTLEVPGVATFNLCHHPYSHGETYDKPDKYAAWRPRDDGRWLLHGHTHEKTGKRKNAINCGVDVWNGYPVSMNQIVSLMSDPREIISPPMWGQTLLDVL